ncbi:MAG: hypothetical protein AAF449_07335, partial [Myxococcota bacterium]
IDIVQGLTTMTPLTPHDMAEISGYHCMHTHRFFAETPPPFFDPQLDALTDVDTYVDEITVRLFADREALAAGRDVSLTSLSLPMQSNRQLLTDPVAHRIAEALFPVAPDKTAQSSHQRFRDLVRQLRSRAEHQRRAGPVEARTASAVMVKGRPVLTPVAKPKAMPVTVAPASELTPFFEFLANPAALLGDGSATTPMTFARGTYFPDGRMDLCKQVVGPGGIGELVDAVERGHDREVASTPMTFARGTYFPDGRMDLCKQVVGPDHIAPLCDAVAAQVDQPTDCRVRHFLLGNNIACDGDDVAGAEAIARLVRNPAVEIETWYLAGNGIGPRCLQVLGPAFEANTHARALWLKRNPVMPEGAAALGRMLARNEALELLDLKNTGLFDEGIVRCVNSFLESGDSPLRLAHLYISANALTERSVAALAAVAEAGRGFSSIRTLNLSINRLGLNGLQALVALIADGALPNLESLDLGSTGLLGPCLKPLVDALIVACPRLRALDLGTYLSTRDLGEEANRLEGDALALQRLLREHPSINLLDVTNCSFTEASLDALFDALGEHQSLEGAGSRGYRHGKLERRLMKHPPRVLHIDSIYRGKA